LFGSNVSPVSCQPPYSVYGAGRSCGTC
jgi:hypothetical protein